MRDGRATEVAVHRHDRVRPATAGRTAATGPEERCNGLRPARTARLGYRPM